MKRIMIIITALIACLLIGLGIYGFIKSHEEKVFDLHTLVPYIEQSDDYLQAKKYYQISTSVKENQIIINFSNEEHKGNLIGILENNVLSFRLNQNDENILLKAMLVCVVSDGIGQINGNEKGYVSSMLNVVDLNKYNLEEDGLSLTSDNEDSIYSFRLNQKFELGNLNNIYFEINDLNKYMDAINSDGFVQTTKAGLVFYKSFIHGKKVIYICEPEHLTNRTYKSLLNFIELLYGQEGKTNFMNNYPNLKTDTVLSNFNITVDYQPEETELVKDIITDNYKILKMIIEA